MIAWISDAMVDVSSKATLPVVAYLSAGLVNLLVPSGGGQWAVQGDVLLAAGHRLGVDPATTIMAFSYGDAWTNMLQPFWALPLLGIMGLRARDIIGYTAIVFMLMAVVVPILLLLLA
jgi:short-chain fatty acids transporter